MSGKGSKRRPEDKKKIDANWDRIFAKPKHETAGQPSKPNPVQAEAANR